MPLHHPDGGALPVLQHPFLQQPSLTAPQLRAPVGLSAPAWQESALAQPRMMPRRDSLCRCRLEYGTKQLESLNGHASHLVKA